AANTAHYSWPGLAIFSLFYSGVLVGMRRSYDASYEKDAHVRNNPPDAQHVPLREEIIAARLSPLFGLPPIRVTADAPLKHPFCTNSRTIMLHPETAKKFSPAETEWIVAHELDHIRNERDLDLTAPAYTFALVGGGGG